MSAKINGSRYVLAVKDLDRSAGFYKDKLGFRTVWADDGWHFLARDSIRIMIGECPDDVSAFETGCHSYFGYFDTENIDDLYAECLSRGIEVVSKLADKPWGQREFAIRTIDGHRITFGQAMGQPSQPDRIV